MDKPTIYFDESNNTGGDLLNKEQKVYVLTSTDFDNEQAKLLLGDYFDIEKEIHFKTLKQSNRGKKQILDFFSDNFELINKNFKTNVFHKEFSACCQLVNDLIEPIFYCMGINFYDEGLNVIYANMFYFCVKAFCGEELSSKLYQSFLNILKEQERSEVTKQYLEIVKNAKEKCSNHDFANKVLSMLEQPIEVVEENLSHIYYRDVDPAYSSLIHLLMIWSNAYPNGFNVAHDESESIKSRIDDIRFFTTLSKTCTDFGYGEVKFTFPINANSIDFVKSEKNYSVQFCDLVASALAFTQNSTSEKNKDFQSILDSILRKHVLQNLVWPSQETSLMKERKIKNGQVDPIDYLAQKYFEIDSSNTR